MSWAQRLQRVFGIEIEIEICARCGGRLKVIASIEDRPSSHGILAHLDRTVGIPPERAPLAARTPPVQAALR